jgi:hypothetical protein
MLAKMRLLITESTFKVLTFGLMAVLTFLGVARLAAIAAHGSVPIPSESLLLY